ncbi:MAG: DUF222 domain-containing protein, partial [Woeseiaceae bacterium]|nr:DUF222 domain-containing protein [Woeseiaceae bacterium]
MPATPALGEQITELCAYIHAATYQLLVLIREFDEQGGWQQPGLASCAHWLNFQCGIGMNAAREKVRVAHALKDLPAVSAAFERGELSYSKVRAMTRIADAGNEAFLMQIARHGTASHMERLVQKFRQAQRLQDAEHVNEQIRTRSVDYRYDADGCLVLTARMPAEQGALLLKALDKVMEDHYEPQEGPEPIAARRADALADMAESYLAGNEHPAATGDRYQVVVHVSAETPGDDAVDPPQIEDGPHVSAETSRRIACDCSLLRVDEDVDGEPLSIGRKSRSIPPAIRRALRLRDKGCRFPGCTNTRFVDGHHVRHWADGGETCMDNLVQLCRHHHRLVHEG